MRFNEFNMKRLTIVRHAKSSWKHDVIDHERPLNKRGFNDAQLVSSYLKDKLEKVDMIWSSDANRAKTTCEIFISNLGIDDSLVTLNHNLYDFSGHNLVNEIKNCNNNINTLMIFGHNHAITSFVNTYGDIFIDNVPTCGLTILEFDIENWDDLKPGRTLKTVFPRDLKNE